MSLLSALLSSSLIQIAAGQPATPPPPPLAPSPPAVEGPAPRVRLDVTATLNGGPAGDITIETDASGDAAIDLAQLVVLITGVASPPTVEALQARSGGSGLVPISELNAAGFSVVFDPAALRVNIVIPMEARAVNELSIIDRRTYLGAGLTQPEGFSAGVTVTLAERFQHDTALDDLDREPFSGLIEGFANVGGVDGVNLAFEGGYREGDNLVRQRTTLFHDDVTSAVRYSLGDIDTQGLSAYAAPVSMIGIGVERLYRTIQPFRNLRPAGRGALTIERPSRVDVLVNGALYRSLNLAPGQYDIRDFPFLDGLNDIQLVVRDETGGEETINLSFFSDVDLLDEDISIFSASLGFNRDRFGIFKSPAYANTPIFSGLYLRGITDRITLGSAAQMDKDNGLLSAQVVVATEIGIFGAEGSLDLGDQGPAQAAFVMSYRFSSPGAGNRTSRLDLDLQYRTASFSPMAAATHPNRFSWDLNARYQRPIDEKTYISVNAGRSWARYLLPDVISAGVSINRRISRINASFGYVFRDDERGTEHRGLLSITVPIGPRQSARASYDTRRNRVSGDYQMQGFEALDQTDVRVGVLKEDDGRGFNLDVEHYSNRFRAAVRHSYERFDGVTQQFTDVATSFGIGYADGQVALGREAGHGFAIVDRHQSLKDAQVVVSDSFGLGPVARTGALGPALVPVRRAYQPTSLRVEVENLPNGYDIGPGRYDINPGAASGYSILIGSAASKTVIGRLVDGAGEPLKFAVGKLEPISGDEAQPAQFFTNRTGRMVATRVGPGRYRVVLAGQTASIGELVVPEDGDGMVDIGELRTGDSR